MGMGDSMWGYCNVLIAMDTSCRNHVTMTHRCFLLQALLWSGAKSPAEVYRHLVAQATDAAEPFDAQALGDEEYWDPEDGDDDDDDDDGDGDDDYDFDDRVDFIDVDDDSGMQGAEFAGFRGRNDDDDDDMDGFQTPALAGGQGFGSTPDDDF
jgi:hypothetical protein